MLFAPDGCFLFPNPEEDLADIATLMSDLTEGRAPARDIGYFRKMLEEQPNLYLAIRRGTTGRIVGMALLFIERKFTALCGHIEDVVVAKSYRGEGHGRSMMKELIAKAAELELDYLELTSNWRNKERRPAIKLYQKLGFVKRTTNVYRLELETGVPRP